MQLLHDVTFEPFSYLYRGSEVTSRNNCARRGEPATLLLGLEQLPLAHGVFLSITLASRFSHEGVVLHPKSGYYYTGRPEMDLRPGISMLLVMKKELLLLSLRYAEYYAQEPLLHVKV